jgi:isopenicillin N synthase-like dioxygenase
MFGFDSDDEDPLSGLTAGDFEGVEDEGGEEGHASLHRVPHALWRGYAKEEQHSQQQPQQQSQQQPQQQKQPQHQEGRGHTVVPFLREQLVTPGGRLLTRSCITASVDADISGAVRCPVGAWLKSGVCIEATAEAATAEAATAEAATAEAATAEAARLRKVLRKHSYAVLTEVPADILRELEQAELACIDFFAAEDSIKKSQTLSLAAAQELKIQSQRDATYIQDLHLWECGYGQRKHQRGKVTREQYHTCVGGWDHCFFGEDDQVLDENPKEMARRHAGNISAPLKLALEPALQRYTSICHAMAGLVLGAEGNQATGGGSIVDILCARASRTGDPSVLDAFVYPNRGEELKGLQHNMADHFDPGYFSITTASYVPGLDVYDECYGRWVDAEAIASSGSELIIFCGESLQRLWQRTQDDDVRCQECVRRDSGDRIWADYSKGAKGAKGAKPCACDRVRATRHRVHKEGDTGTPRMSLVYELRSHHDGLEEASEVPSA